jgi:uncharacterized protein YcfL
MKTSRLYFVCAVPLALALLAGCTSQPQRVSCDQHLEPINAPAPKVAESNDKEPSLQVTASGSAP